MKNNLIVALGGRKFLMALVVIGAAMFLEMRAEKGLTPTMAGFLGGIVTAFAAANYAVSAKHMQKGSGQLQVTEEMERQGQELVSVLNVLTNEVKEVKDLTSKTGQAVVSISKR